MRAKRNSGKTGVDMMIATIICLLFCCLIYSVFLNPSIEDCQDWAKQKTLEICQLQWQHALDNDGAFLGYDAFVEAFNEYGWWLEHSRWDIAFDFPDPNSGYLFSVIFTGQKGEKTEGYTVTRSVDHSGWPNFLEIKTPKDNMRGA